MKRFSLLLFGFISCLQLILAQNITVATYNVRYDNEEDARRGDGWKNRCPVQVKMILFNDIDILGTQEVLNNQLLDLQKGLPEYEYIGVGRDDGKTKGEYAPIFYKKSKFRLLDSGHFWLSEHEGYPNKGWDAVLPRICTWGKFEVKESGKELWFFNLHMDHVGTEARSQSAKLVLKKIKEMCNNAPVILTGDFNVDQTSESYRLLAESGVLFDSYNVTKLRYATNGTFNAWSTSNFTESRIDHIFVSKNLTVERYGILTDTYRSAGENSKETHEGDFPVDLKVKNYIARLPSDHFMVKTGIFLKK
ncbi:MAG: endonuclease/exonuclease/phosphatase family protein [Dysgonamonadaceae bacterium]